MGFYTTKVPVTTFEHKHHINCDYCKDSVEDVSERDYDRQSLPTGWTKISHFATSMSMVSSIMCPKCSKTTGIRGVTTNPE